MGLYATPRLRRLLWNEDTVTERSSSGGEKGAKLVGEVAGAPAGCAAVPGDVVPLLLSARAW